MAKCVWEVISEKLADEISSKKWKEEELYKKKLEEQLLNLLLENKNLDSYNLKNGLSSALNVFIEKSISNDLKTTNDIIQAKSSLSKSQSDFNNNLENFLINEHMTWTVFPSTTWSITSFLNRNYKNLTLWPSIWRALIEVPQINLVNLINKVSLRNIDVDLEIIKWRIKWDFVMPDAWKIEREVTETKHTNLLPTQYNSIMKILSMPGNKLTDISWWLIEKWVAWAKWKIYWRIFKEKLIEKYNELSNTWKDYAYILFKDDSKLSIENKARKFNLLQQVRREARKEASKLIFDYAENPLLIHKLETFIPFTNYMYSWIRSVQRYPQTMWFLVTFLNQLNNQYWEPSQYLDEEWQKIDAWISLRFWILASLWLWWVWLNLQRLMHFSPTQTNIQSAPIYTWLTNRDDWRFQKFYKDWEIDDYFGLTFSMFSPTLQKFFDWISHLTNPVEWKENHYKNFTESIAYIVTWMVIKDKTQSILWEDYINKDFDKMLSIWKNQLKVFLEHPTNKEKWLTIRSIEAAKEAKELWLLNTSYEKNPRDLALEIFVWNWIRWDIVDKEVVNTNQKEMRKLVEMILPSQSDWTWDFLDFLNKVESFSKSQKFKDFQNYSPAMYDIYKHYSDNNEYYKQRTKIYETIKNWDETEKKDASIKLVALNYRFEWDEDMTLNEKFNALKYWTLKKPLISKWNDILPAWPVMTEWYFNSFENIWGYVKEYINQSNAVIWLKKIRNLYWNLSYANTGSKKEYYANLAKQVQEEWKNAFRLFKETATPEFHLYLLSKEFEDFSKNYDNYSSIYYNNENQKDLKKSSDLIDRLNWLKWLDENILKNTFWNNKDDIIINLSKSIMNNYDKEDIAKLQNDNLNNIINSLKQ